MQHTGDRSAIPWRLTKDGNCQGLAGAHDCPPIFLVSERTQFGNLGDIVLNRVLLELLAEQGSVATIRATAPPASLTVAVRRFAVQRLAALAAIREVLRARLHGRTIVLCLNPGGYSGGVSVRILVAAVGYAFMRLAGLQIVRIGFSLGPVTPARRWIECWQYSLYAACAVRDRQSRAQLVGTGAPPPALLPDLALLASDFGPVRHDHPRTQLLVSLRAGTDARRRALHARMVPVLQELAVEFRLELAFVAQVSSDVPHLAELAGMAGCVLHVLDTDDSAVVDRARDLYSSALVLLTNRLHAGMFAAMAGCVPVALIDLARDQKIVGLMQDAKCSDLVHDEVDLENLPDRIREVVERSETVSCRLLRACEVASALGRHRTRRLLAAVIHPAQAARKRG